MKKKVSIGILTYNHEQFIAQCLKSCLDLKYENLQIIISDDSSKDRTVEIITDVLKNTTTSHEVVFIKNPQNLGLAGNFNKIFYETADGDFLITLGGDDVIIYDYIEFALSYFQKDEKIMMLDFNGQIIDQHNNLKGIASKIDFQEKLFNINDYLKLLPIHTFAPGRMIKKELITVFSNLSIKCPTEDSVLVIRALLCGKICRVNKEIVYYRRHDANISNISNLIKMSNLRIVAQYSTDALEAYNVDLIDETITARLLQRFQFELRKREIVYSLQNLYLKRFKMKFNKFIYKYL